MAVAILSSAASVFAQGNTSKLSPYLMQVMQEQATTHRVAAATQVTVLAKLADGADEQALAAQYGFEVLNRIGRVLIIRMALSDIPAMADNKDVVRIEAERAPRPMMDLVPQQIQADLVHSGISNGLDANYNGKGVVVGIVDAGFDYIHPFFRDSEGQTRVVWAADYMKNKKYTTRADITNAMHSSDAATMYHGTHVAGRSAVRQLVAGLHRHLQLCRGTAETLCHQLQHGRRHEFLQQPRTGQRGHRHPAQQARTCPCGIVGQ